MPSWLNSHTKSQLITRAGAIGVTGVEGLRKDQILLRVEQVLESDKDRLSQLPEWKDYYTKFQGAKVDRRVTKAQEELSTEHVEEDDRMEEDEPQPQPQPQPEDETLTNDESDGEAPEVEDVIQDLAVERCPDGTHRELLSYAAIKVRELDVTLTVTLKEREKQERLVKEEQQKRESLIEKHYQEKAELFAENHRLQLHERNLFIAQLQKELKDKDRELAELRASH